MIRDVLKIEKIRELIWAHGGTDGAHHKQWLLNEILLASFDSKDEYEEWIVKYEEPDEDGEPTYEWDRGIAP